MRTHRLRKSLNLAYENYKHLQNEYMSLYFNASERGGGACDD